MWPLNQIISVGIAAFFFFPFMVFVSVVAQDLKHQKALCSDVLFTKIKSKVPSLFKKMLNKHSS